MGLAQLNCSELRLKRLTHRHGLLGFDKLVTFLLSEWLQDIKKNQLPSLLGGVGPMHSLVQLCKYAKETINDLNKIMLHIGRMNFIVHELFHSKNVIL